MPGLIMEDECRLSPRQCGRFNKRRALRGRVAGQRTKCRLKSLGQRGGNAMTGGMEDSGL
jgi:hypothetical protein